MSETQIFETLFKDIKPGLFRYNNLVLSKLKEPLPDGNNALFITLGEFTKIDENVIVWIF